MKEGLMHSLKYDRLITITNPGCLTIINAGKGFRSLIEQ